MLLFFIISFLVLVFLFHIFVYHEYHSRSFVNAVNKIPGPPGTFYFGSSIKFYRLKNKELLYDIIEYFKTWGPTYRLWYSGSATVFVSDLADVQMVLSSRQNNGKGLMYNMVYPWLGEGLLTSSGEKWTKMRKIITPAFHFSVLQDYIDVFNRNANVLMKILDKEAEKDAFHLPKFVTHCALDNVCETAMGTQVNALSDGNNPYVQGIFRIGQIIVKRVFSPFIFSKTGFACSALGWEHSKVLKTLHGFTSRIIREKMTSNEMQKDPVIKGVAKKDEEPVNLYKKKRSFLDVLLQSQQTYALSFQSIREEVDTFMFEGHDTTASAINWTLFELGHHPDIQEQCYTELVEIFGKSDRSPTHSDLSQMELLKRVIKESLRLYPSVPVISRKFTEDFQLSKYVVPAGADIVLVLYAIHRNPAVFPEPDKFDPDRFLPEEVEKRHSFAYIPFSAGQRNCIGQRFAVLEELVILSSIIRNFKIESLNDRNSVKVVPEVILRPHEKLLFKLTKRS